MRTGVPRMLRTLVPRGSMMRNVAVLVAGTAGGQAVVLVASPLLTRLYTPAAFGYLSVFVALMALVVVIGSLRYEIAVSVASTDDDAANVLALSVGLTVVISAVTALLLAWLHAPLLALLHAEPLAPFLWLLPLSILGGAVYQALSYWAIRKEKFGPLGRSTVARAVIQVGVQLGLGALGAGTPGLLGGDAIGRLGSAVPLAGLVWRSRRSRPRSVSLRNMWREAKRHRNYPTFSAIGALMSTASLQVPALLFLALYDARTAGLIALAQRVIGAPVTLLGKSVSQVYVGQAARLAREAPGRLPTALLMTVLRLLVVAAVPTAILALAGPWLFGHVFGSDWRTAGHFVRLLAPMFLVQFTVYPVSETLNLLQRQRLRLAWDVVRLGLLVVAFWLANVLGWSASAAVVAYGLVMLGSYVALFVLSWTAARTASASGAPPTEA